MAKVVITITDMDTEEMRALGMVDVRLEFEPEVKINDMGTPAQCLASEFMDFMEQKKGTLQ